MRGDLGDVAVAYADVELAVPSGDPGLAQHKVERHGRSCCGCCQSSNSSRFIGDRFLGAPAAAGHEARRRFLEPPPSVHRSMRDEVDRRLNTEAGSTMPGAQNAAAVVISAVD
jgi:hypothetical protein